MTVEIKLIPILQDNYAYAVIDNETNSCAIVDPGEAGPVISFLDEHKLQLEAILLTHHHGDHVAGVPALKEKYQAPVYGPEKDRPRLPFLDHGYAEGDTYSFAGHDAKIMETPGHTSNHIIYWFRDLDALFSGDTLFSMGCGRLFEGTADEMWMSLNKIKALPNRTKIYCGHEYTLSDGKFCTSIEPDNQDLLERLAEAEELRKQGLPTLPVTLETEKKTNAFLRAGSAERFAEIRTLKDAA